MPLPDDEDLYRFIQQEAWLDALQWLHAAWRRLDGDARARRAAEVFDAAFFDDVAARPTEALERRLMLHHGRMRTLPEALLARLAETLAERKRQAGDVEAVRALERLSADAEAADVRTMQRETFETAGVGLTRVAPVGERADARRSLFKSEQEAVFFRTLRDVFPTYLVYPNAALSAVLEYEQLASALTPPERAYFFRALVDAVVVDPLDDFRPVHFFELDSAHHDAPSAKENDALKDAILAKAGQVLFRLRREHRDAPAEAFGAAVRRAVEDSL